MFYISIFLICSVLIQGSLSNLTTNFVENEYSLKNEEVSDDRIANLEKEIAFLRNRMTKIEENDLESNITEIMRILETHGLVSISNTFSIDEQTSK